jgi:hypothetical protein
MKNGPYRPKKAGARKYVAFKDGSVITFQRSTPHIVAAKKHGGTPVAGGFFYKKNSKVKVIGYSDSLGLPSRKSDKHKIERKKGKK